MLIRRIIIETKEEQLEETNRSMSLTELKAENKKKDETIKELKDKYDFQIKHSKEGEKEWKDEINQHNETKKELEELKETFEDKFDRVRDYLGRFGGDEVEVFDKIMDEEEINQHNETKKDRDQLLRRFNRAIEELGAHKDHPDEGIYSTDEDEIEDNDPEEYGEYLSGPQPLDSGWAEIMGYDDETKGLFKLFDEFKPPVVEHTKELKEDYEKAGQAIGDCLEATTSFAWLIADYPQYANEVKVMCFAHKYSKVNPQSPDNNIRIHWVLVYKDFLVDCSNGRSRGIWKSNKYFAYIPTLLGSHTCKLSVYLGKLDKKYEVNQDNLYKYLGITMNEFYAKYLPEVEVINKKEIMKTMTKKD